MIGIKDAKGKMRWSLLPFDSLKPIVRVLTFGAITKYAKDNWKHVPQKAAYADAIIRHWTSYFMDGEETDPESGESHLAHMGCDILFLIWDRENKKDVPFHEYLSELLQYKDYVTDLDENKFN